MFTPVSYPFVVQREQLYRNQQQFSRQTTKKPVIVRGHYGKRYQIDQSQIDQSICVIPPEVALVIN